MSGGLSKKLCKDLAAELATLRPKDLDSDAHVLWLAMVEKVSDGAVPMHLGTAFTATCLGHGVWAERYVESR